MYEGGKLKGSPRPVSQPPWTLLRSDELAMGRRLHSEELLENALVDPLEPTKLAPMLSWMGREVVGEGKQPKMSISFALARQEGQL